MCPVEIEVMSRHPGDRWRTSVGRAVAILPGTIPVMIGPFELLEAVHGPVTVFRQVEANRKDIADLKDRSREQERGKQP